MKKTFKIVEPNYVDACNEIMSAFGYQKISQKKLFCSKCFVLKYQKDNNDNLHLNVEYKYSPRFEMPMFVIALIAIIIFALATTFLVRFVIKGDGYDKLLDFMCFMLPAFILILVDTGIAIWRYFASVKNAQIYNSVNTIKEELKND